jgi:hypothetical protein
MQNDNILGDFKGDVSIIQDPFQLGKIESITVHGTMIVGKPRWSGHIEFANGLTQGSQDTGPCKDFEEVIHRLRAILTEVQRK